jgi:hypothetical protein
VSDEPGGEYEVPADYLGSLVPSVKGTFGTEAERRLLGAVIMQPDLYRSVEDLVLADDFSDAQMGSVWDGIGQMVSRKMHVDQLTVIDQLSSWGIRGYEAEVWTWSEGVYPWALDSYARVVKDDSVRRQAGAAVWAAGREFQKREPGGLGGTETVQAYSSISVTSKLHQTLGDIIDRATATSHEVKTLRQVLLGVDTYDWVIPGLLERMDRLVITGGEGAGKTTWCRQIVVLAAAGIHPTTFGTIDPIRALVIDAENTEKQWRRGVRWLTSQAAKDGGADPQDRIFIRAGRRFDITQGQELARIHRYIDQYEPDVVYIGPLYKMVPGAIQNDNDAAPLIVALDSIRERGVALIMEAHAGKATDGSGGRNLAPRGSSAILGWPEFGLGIRPNAEADPKLGLFDVVRWRGDRDQRDFPTSMIRGGPLWPWQPDSF